MSNVIMEKLQAPFTPEDVEWRVDRYARISGKVYVTVLPYITSRAIQNRLDEVFGPFGWKNEFVEWKEGQVCGISVKHGDEWITKWDGADCTKIEKIKGGLSGAMKRAAVQWGIGRYLYKLDEQRIEVKQNGDNWFKGKIDNSEVKGYWDTPKIPSWALPEGYKYSANDQKKSQQQSPTETDQYSTPSQQGKQQQRQSTRPDQQANKEEYKCSKCQKTISKGVYQYSMDKFKKPLCQSCR